MASNVPSLRIRIRQNASVKEKTLIRVVAETLKKLVHLYQVKNAEEILTSFDIQALRYKLKECLSRLMFLEPLEFGQKAEDTIWKSIFYEPIRIFKKELKNQPNISNSKSLLLVGFKRHILGAIGYYHKLIMRLETEYGFVGKSCINQREALDTDKKDVNIAVSPALKSWSFRCIQHCLLYIGDLYRYEAEIKSSHSRSLAIRYYNNVLQLNPFLGHAYNQLATLDTLSYYGLNAAYYYLKAQLCENSFAQAKDNLVILFERNIKRLRSVLDRESLIKKSGTNMGRGSMKVLRVKSSIIKYLNLWYSFSTSYVIENHEAKQLAVMCDDVLNNLSYVLGFDRKLMPESSSSTGARPSTLSCHTVSEILFIANACMKSMWRDNEQEERQELQREPPILDLAHTFTLNLYGHVFNQCLVRIRDEIRATNIDISLLFRRYDNAEVGSLTNDECEEPTSSEATTLSSEHIVGKHRKKKVALSKRLVRTRHDTGETQSLEDDLSEDETNLSPNENVLWDDKMSDSSDSDHGKGFGFTESEDETDFESDDEIHSQDEDDQIIRAIVGPSTVFGRQQSGDKEPKRARGREADKGALVSDMSTMYGESASSDRQEQLKRPRQRPPIKEAPPVPAYGSPSPETLVRCIRNIDLLQSLTVFSQSMHCLSRDSLDSFNRVWHSAPYLWKHFAVLLNFCENLLDDFSNSSLGELGCSHIRSDVRGAACAVLPEDAELRGSLLALDEVGVLVCDNDLHQVVTRLNRIVRCGFWLSSVANGPLQLQKGHNGNVWLFSYSHNAPRVNLVSKSWTQIYAGSDTQCNSAIDKEMLMRKMARLRLENELSSNSETEDNKDRKQSQSRATKTQSPCVDRGRAVYLIPDVNMLCSRLDVISAVLRTEQFIVVIPQAVIQRLDKKKTVDHSARQAIKFLEAEMQQNNEHIKIEAIVAPSTPQMPCDLIPEWPAIENSAVRLALMATPASVSGCDVVVTVLSDRADQLQANFKGHYAALRVDFKTNIEV